MTIPRCRAQIAAIQPEWAQSRLNTEHLARSLQPGRAAYVRRFFRGEIIHEVFGRAYERVLLRSVLDGCLPVVQAQGPLSMKKGSGGSEVQGSAGPGGSQGDTGQEKCDKPMGAMAVVEPQDYV